jgi:HD-GYP domain-containing protein (c-di-GMP phosphodiesterase class II)
MKQADHNMYREKIHNRPKTICAFLSNIQHALASKDFLAHDHVDRLRDWSVKLVSRAGYSEQIIPELSLLVQFHDIGNILISDSILFKLGPLAPEERAEIEAHCENGYRIAQCFSELTPIAELILKHHEWWNGQGYPLGLKGEEIPASCRILAIVDAYNAMTSDRPYRKSMTDAEARQELINGMETQFDPFLTELFLDLLK